LAGRAPVGITALVMEPPAGAELACQARNYLFGWGRGMQERGVISYYAAQTLPEVATVADWANAIALAVAADARSGRLPRTHRPLLQVIGAGDRLLPGQPAVAARALSATS
jgi:hypothetical protein